MRIFKRDFPILVPPGTRTLVMDGGLYYAVTRTLVHTYAKGVWTNQSISMWLSSSKCRAEMYNIVLGAVNDV